MLVDYSYDDNAQSESNYGSAAAVKAGGTATPKTKINDFFMYLFFCAEISNICFVFFLRDNDDDGEGDDGEAWFQLISIGLRAEVVGTEPVGVRDELNWAGIFSIQIWAELSWNLNRTQARLNWA